MDLGKAAKKILTRTKYYTEAMLKWVIVSLFIGVFCGLIGTAFHIGVARATTLREQNPWLLYCLPAAGLLIVWIYRVTKSEGKNTNDVIEAVHFGKKLPILLIPAIFFSTMLTHLCGGSVGREGAALQMGGDIGFQSGKLFRLSDEDSRIATLCGMAAFFSALFGTPLAATMFAIMVISIGVFYHVAFIPCFVASMVSYGVSLFFGVRPTRFAVPVPDVTAPMLIRIAVLGLLCAFVSILFCRSIRGAEHLFKKKFPNKWLRAVVGGVLVILLTLLSGTTDYNGAGMNVIRAAVEDGSAHPEAFLLKILFTSVTLAGGYKGGEVVPAFFTGAVFGCVAGPFLGIPAGFAAAVGLASVFCGAVNCPVSAIFLAAELFGSGGIYFFALACGVSYIFSGYSGLYSSQTILYSKVRAKYLNVRTNHHHIGEMPEKKNEVTEIETEKNS